MREILFRGKRIDNGEWVKGFYFRCKPNNQYVKENHYIQPIRKNGTAGILQEVDPETVGQYTGLTDKNGVKIFEGDILKWDETEWGCPHGEVATWDYGLFDSRKSTWEEFCEVSGNIHDSEVVK